MSTVAIAGQTFTFPVCLYKKATTTELQTPPTLALGDFQRSINDAGAWTNLDNLPTVNPAAGAKVVVILSVAETTAAGAGGYIQVKWEDALGGEWASGYADMFVHAAEIDAACTVSAINNNVITGASMDATADQEIRDAMKLAPTAGAPVAGSVDAHLDSVLSCTCGSGSIAFTYTVTSTATGLPLDGVQVWVSTDLAGLNVIWYGTTDAFGIARSPGGTLPMLDPGTYYFWKQLSGYDPEAIPDTEVVS